MQLYPTQFDPAAFTHEPLARQVKDGLPIRKKPVLQVTLHVAPVAVLVHETAAVFEASRCEGMDEGHAPRAEIPRELIQISVNRQRQGHTSNGKCEREKQAK